MTDIELTLPASARKLVARASPSRINPGLQLDKLSSGGDQQAQGKALASVTRCSGDGELLDELLVRRDAALADLGAVRMQGRTVGPLTLHLSRSGALENAGIALNPVYGFAWLPGTGLKGLTRAWAETVWASAPEQVDKVAAWNKIRAVFGTSPQSDRGKGWLPDELNPPAEDSVGRIVFHDAWPTAWPELVRDIVNNHHSKYYQGNGRDYPGDWEDPVPVNFLAVADGTIFDFAVSDRAPVEDGLAEQARDWLRSALTHAGAGAKTAAGYGRIVPVEGDRPPAPRGLLRSEHSLRLVTPAFLAGAAQDASDCDLRPATLRGLLRWWWRTMHAGHLRSGELAELEALVWGDTESGSPVSISLEPRSRAVPREYRKTTIKREHKLAAPRGRAIQGLFYTSYGMDEKSSSRWYLDAGVKWDLVLTARDGYWRKKETVPANLMMEQAECALWLLARFGGAGSKSRKGFGSLRIEGMRSIQSVQDCLRVAKRIRDQCGLATRESVERSATSALECRIETEIPTTWEDPWQAIDRVGTVYQEFVKELKPKRDRRALGLPRSIGKPRQQLRANGDIDRHAAPVHWSLDQTAKGCLVVRFVAFPAARLPDWNKSRSILTQLKESAESTLRKDGRQGEPRAGQSTRFRVSPPQQDAVLPRSGSRVRAVLLEERTKKGGWKARTVDGRLSGHISNTASVPTDRQPGDEVELVVTSAKPAEAIFRWPLAIAEPPSGNVRTTKAATGRPSGRSRPRKR